MKRTITLLAVAGIAAAALAGCSASNDAAAKAGEPIAAAITSSLADHSDFGTAPKDNTSAIVLDTTDGNSSVIVSMTDPEPAAETTMIAANLKIAEGTKITESGISGKKLCVTVTSGSGKAVYTQDGLAKGASGCAADGSAS